MDSKESPMEEVDAMLNSLIEQLGSTKVPAFTKIARITVLHSSDPFVRAITAAFHVSKRERTIE
jgi:hypothetical protein